VSGIRQQRQAVRPQADDDLDTHEAGRQRQRDGERTTRRVRRDVRVRVPMSILAVIMIAGCVNVRRVIVPGVVMPAVIVRVSRLG